VFNNYTKLNIKEKAKNRDIYKEIKDIYQL